MKNTAYTVVGCALLFLFWVAGCFIRILFFQK